MWSEFKKRKIGVFALSLVALFFLIGLYAPFLASSKPIALFYQGKIYFPLFRYLFYPGFFTKPIDLFYNILMFTLPLACLVIFFFKKWKKALLLGLLGCQIIFFSALLLGMWKNPERHLEISSSEALPDWNFELSKMNDYAKLNLLLQVKQREEQERRLQPYLRAYEREGKISPTLFGMAKERFEEEKRELNKAVTLANSARSEAAKRLPALVEGYIPLHNALLLAEKELHSAEKNNSPEALQMARTKFQEISAKEREKKEIIAVAKDQIQQYKNLTAKERMLEEKKSWEQLESARVQILFKPLIRPFHWEDDAGGGQGLNKYLPWWELTRINRKDLTAALLFGIRISLVVGIMAVALALLIGIPLGVISGYFAGKFDIFACRLIEIWEAMPAFFMLLLIIAILQSKSLFLVIFILALFGWTHFTRYIRAEVLRQRSLPYITAAKSLGFSHRKIMFSHILPNALPPVLTLLPFSIMAAITSEAGLSFLGLGEEGSTSWGVLMAEGRSVFPGESYLLWPAAILLTILLVSIALVGDALRDALDPKMR